MPTPRASQLPHSDLFGKDLHIADVCEHSRYPELAVTHYLGQSLLYLIRRGVIKLLQQ